MKKNNKKLIFTLSVIALVAITWFFVPKEAAAEKLYEVLSNTTTDGTPGYTIAGVWRSILNLVNVFIIIVLIFIAFANILRININTYGIKKFLPTLFLAVIAANFSFLFCRLFVDFSNAIHDLLINGGGAGIEMGTVDTTAPASIEEVCNGAYDSPQIGIAKSFCVDKELENSMVTANGTFDWAVLGKYIFYSLIQLAGAIFVLILAVLFFIRNYVIYFLVALSPLAMMSIILPQTKQAWNMWWTNFMRWAFLPTISLFWIWVGAKWMGLGIDTSGFSLMSAIFAGVCFYLAITTPFKMGGSIMNAWGNIGKKAWGAASYHPKRAAQKWWGNQAAHGKWYNPVGHIARIKPMQDRKAADFDRALKDTWDDKVQARLSRTRTGGKQDIREAKLGGEAEKAKAESMKRYLRTEKGKKWANEDRSRWLEQKANTEKEVETRLSEGQAAFRKTEEGMDMSSERLILDQEQRISEEEITAIEKEHLTQFMQNRGRFASPEMKALLANRIGLMSDNLMLDESVKKSQQDNIDPYFSDQLHLHSLANKDVVQYKNLIKKRDAGNISQEEERDLARLRQELAGRDIDREYEEIQTHIRNLIEQRKESPIGVEHLKGYLSPNGLGDMKDYLNLRNGQENIEFNISGMDQVAAKRLNTEDKDAIRDFTKIMVTRMGKLMGMEMAGDVDKLLDKKTIREIATTLDEQMMLSSPNLYRELKASNQQEAVEALRNFKNGSNHLNRPEINREIEVCQLALGKIARQRNHMEATDAASGMANMLSDQAALQAREEYHQVLNRYAEEIYEDSAQRVNFIDKNMIYENDPNQIRDKFSKKLLTRGVTSNFAYGAVTRQPSMGFSRNSSEYLSGYVPDSAGDHHNQPIIAEISNEQIVGMSKSLAEAFSNPNTGFSKAMSQLGNKTEEVAGHLTEVGNHLSHMRKYLAADVASQVGANIAPENRKLFQETLANLPAGASGEDIAEAIRSVDPSFNKSIDPNTTINLTQMDGGKAKVRLGDIPTKAGNIEYLQRGVDIMAERGNAISHRPYIQTLSTRDKKTIESNYQTLDSAYQVVQNIDIPEEQRIEAASNALKNTSFAPAGDIGSLAEKSSNELYSRLAFARNAAEASMGAFDENGRFDINRATDNLVESKVQLRKGRSE